MKTLKIGKLKLKNPLVLAPMVDVTDLPYRLLCRRAGAALAYTEMLYVDAILHDNFKTEQLMKTGDSPLGLQITGNGEEEMEAFVASGKWKPFDLIDLNCGCPSVRITGNSAGSYLLKNPEKISRFVEILRKTGKPVTVKIRLGFKKNNVMKVARAVEKAGAAALTVHGRLAIHGRDVPADWKEIARVKKALKIPVIGNGDVFSGADAARLLEVCDGVMIARGAIGDPLIFERVLKYLKSRDLFPTGQHPTTHPTTSDKANASEDIDFRRNVEQYLEYLKLEKKYFGSTVDLGRVKYLGGKFLRGLDGAARMREELMRMKSLAEIEKMIAGLMKKNQ